MLIRGQQIKLSRREAQLCDLLLNTSDEGKVIAYIMGLEPSTIRAYTNRLCRKLGVKGRIELLVLELKRLREILDERDRQETGKVDPTS